jgi:PhzF family phenazine biosynthesis protein
MALAMALLATPQRVPYLLVDAFTNQPEQGNRAGVVLAAGLSPSQMQAIASRLAVSETVFVTATEGCDFWVRFFSPRAEVDFCGHATLALGHVLAAQSLVAHDQDFYLKTMIGAVAVGRRANGEVWMRQAPPQFRPLPPEARSVLAEALGLDQRLTHRALPLAAASTGLWTGFLPLVEAGLLSRLEPDLALLGLLASAWNLAGVMVYGASGPRHFVTRFFAAALGGEDPVTGSASGALAALLARANVLPRRERDGQFESELWLSQGHSLGKPGEVQALVEYSQGPQGAQPSRIHVGGQAVTVFEGVLKL